jgi:Domain of Unknown Function (DUF1206)
LEWPARLGYAIYGLLYLAIGGLALVAALGSAGLTIGTRAALRALLDEPAVPLVLGALVAGFASHAVWRTAQALTDADRKGDGLEGLVSRVEGLVSRGGKLAGTIASAALSLYGLSLLFGWGSDLDLGDSRRGDWVAWLLRRPSGRWLIGTVGTMVFAGGAAQTVLNAKRDFRQDFDMSAGARRLVGPVMRFGLLMHGLVNLAVGTSILVAAARANVIEIRSLGDLFDMLQAQPYGGALLGFAALGLIAFGISNLIHSVWRRIDSA